MDYDYIYFLFVFMYVVLYKFCIYICICVSIILKINIFIIEFFLILDELLSFGCLWMFLVCIDRNIDICFRWYLVS